MTRYDFMTKRLLVKEWHSFDPAEINQTELADTVADILLPEITADFPAIWQGKYTKKRAKFWIEERDSEGTTILAVEKKTKNPIGFLHFFGVGDKSKGIQLRLGYTITKTMWKKGYATELVEGFILWCKKNSVPTLSATVNHNNKASIKVLQKNNFTTQARDTNGLDYLFMLECMK